MKTTIATLQTLILTATATLLVATPALARDSSHLSCTGFMSAEQGPDDYGLAVQFDEGRAADGTSRNEVLSIVWASDLYQGSRLNKNDDFGKNGVVVMKSKDSAKRVFFKGKYNVESDAKTGAYKLRLVGLIDLEPSASGRASFEKISTTLSCVDLSN